MIENDFTKIVFLEPVNLLNMDISGIIFEESKISLENVPEFDRLNMPCIIEFKKFGLKQLNSGKTKD